MKVFISSLISGLEALRDAASSGVTTLGHRAVRAEDFGATPDSPLPDPCTQAPGERRAVGRPASRRVVDACARPVRARGRRRAPVAPVIGYGCVLPLACPSERCAVVAYAGQ